jgi:hypothetical protein
VVASVDLHDDFPSRSIEVDDARPEQQHLPTKPDAQLPCAKLLPEQLFGGIAARQPHSGSVTPKLERAM